MKYPPTPRQQEVLEAVKELKNFLDQALVLANRYSTPSNEDIIRTYARAHQSRAFRLVTEAFLISYEEHSPSIDSVYKALDWRAKSRRYARDIMDALVANDLLGRIEPVGRRRHRKEAFDYHRLHAYTPYFPPGDEYGKARLVGHSTAERPSSRVGDSLGKGAKRADRSAESVDSCSIDNATADVNTILNYLGPPPEPIGQERPEPTPSPAGTR